MEERYQSFQYPSARKRPTVASPGPNTGSTMRVRIVPCPAPSILADSTIASGTEPVMNVRIKMTRNGLMIAGNQMANVVPFSPRIFVYIKYHATSPPPKIEVK